MSELTPEMLVEKMRDASHRAYYDTIGGELVGKRLHEYLAKVMLRVVLKEINDGKVIDAYRDMEFGDAQYKIKPSYQKFLESGA